MKDMSDDDGLGADLESLFTCNRYEMRHFHHGDFNLKLMCSPSACTDYDLTGQIIWPAATLLADYLAENPVVMASSSCACELGSGLGLAGLLCGQLCPTCLTDHNPIVLKVLQQNAELNQADHPIRSKLMDWSNDAQIARVKQLSDGGKGFDLLLGADVCYSLTALPSLLHAASELLSNAPAAVFILAYVSRSKALDRGLEEQVDAAGFLMEEIPGSRKRVDGGALEGMIYRLTWKDRILE